jgi:hsp70-interacting protein
VVWDALTLPFFPGSAEELKDHVEDIDQACDLSKVGGLPPLLSTIRGSPHARLRALAAEIVATCCQNNPKAQQQFLDAGALDAVLLLARDDADPTARLKGLFATSALVRQNPAGQKAFRLGDGFGMLKRAMCDDREPKIQRRAFILAKHLATSHDMHLDTMAQLGYIRAGASALASRSSDVREASLGMLLDIARHVNFERFPTAVDDFRHPMLVAGLGAIRTTLAKQTDEGERDASADERELADQLAVMLGMGK